jgi:ABC-type branched-subunit amino acid transport system ATPase component
MLLVEQRAVEALELCNQGDLLEAGRLELEGRARHPVER